MLNIYSLFLWLCREINNVSSGSGIEINREKEDGEFQEA